MKEFVVVLIFIILLTGVVHTFRYSSWLVNFVVGFTLFLGFFGLHSVYTSILYKTKKKRWLNLVVSLICVFLAYSILEFLLMQMGR